MIAKIVKRIDPALVVIVLSLAFTIGSVWCAWDIYTDHVGFEYSNESSQWAALGGYLAGIGSVLGPILSAASILFVWWQGRSTAAAQQDQISQIKKQVGLQAIADLQRTYEAYLQKLPTLLEKSVEVNTRINAYGIDIWELSDDEYSGQPIRIANLLKYYKFEDAHKGEGNKPSKTDIQNGIRELMGHLISQIEIIASYLDSYDHFEERFQVNTYNHLVRDFNNFIDNTKALRPVIEYLEIKSPTEKEMPR